MPQYYFHMLDSGSFRDREGEAMASPAAAQKETLRIMGDVLRDGAPGFWDTGAFSVLCVDADGVMVVGLTAHRITPGEAESLMDRVDAEDA